jgi:hypothetical protein
LSPSHGHGLPWCWVPVLKICYQIAVCVQWVQSLNISPRCPQSVPEIISEVVIRSGGTLPRCLRKWITTPQPLKSIYDQRKAVQQEGLRKCMLRSTFSSLLNVSLFDLSMLLYNLTIDPNQKICSGSCPHSLKTTQFVVVRLTPSVPFRMFTLRM